MRMLGEGIEAEALADLRLPVDPLLRCVSILVKAAIGLDKVAAISSDCMFKVVGPIQR